MIEPRKTGMWQWISGHRWIVAGMAIYAASFVYVLSTLAFGAEDSARTYIAHVSSHAAHEPVPSLPVMHSVQWPDLSVRHDPFQRPPR